MPKLSGFDYVSAFLIIIQLAFCSSLSILTVGKTVEHLNNNSSRNDNDDVELSNANLLENWSSSKQLKDGSPAVIAIIATFLLTYAMISKGMHTFTPIACVTLSIQIILSLIIFV